MAHTRTYWISAVCSVEIRSGTRPPAYQRCASAAAYLQNLGPVALGPLLANHLSVPLPSASSGPQVRVLTFNTEFGPWRMARLNRLGELLEGIAVDVVLLQELCWRRHLATLRSVASSYPFAAFGPWGPLQRCGLAILTRSPLRMIRMVPYAPCLCRKHVPNWTTGKGLLIAETEIDGSPLILIDTHVAHNPGGDWSRSNVHAKCQRRQLDRLVRELDRLPRQRLVLLAGDLNLPPGSWLYEEFVEQAGLEAIGDASQATIRASSRVVNPNRIDHVLLRPPSGSHVSGTAHAVFDKEVIRRGHLHRYLSDHLGVLAQIDVGASPATPDGTHSGGEPSR